MPKGVLMPAGFASPAYREPEKRSEVKSAFDKDYDPTYGEGMDRQHVAGGTSFADLREDMNARRRKTARRMSDRGHGCCY